MKFSSFHHPDISFPVMARRTTDEIMQLVAGLGDALSSRGRSLAWGDCYPSKDAYNSAIYRLRKNGLVVNQRGKGQSPVLELTEEGESRLPVACRSRYPWKKKWNGIWYVLIYDVPETSRSYRDTLRGFLQRMQMGCLQKSVWVTPHDIRPDYQDLADAANVEAYSFLFEAMTVLGRSTSEVACLAWDFDKIIEAQEWYCKACSSNIKKLSSKALSRRDVITLARDELTAYTTMMERDPFLPTPLWPSGYRGDDVWKLHRQITRAISHQLRAI